MREIRYPPELPKRLMGPIQSQYISLGEGSYAQADCILVAHNEYSIRIGTDCAIGHWCYLSTRMHKTDNHREYFEGNIVIEDNCWLGNSVVVYPGVTIGHHCVVGHATTVVHDMPPHTLLKNKSVLEMRG